MTKRFMNVAALMMLVVVSVLVPPALANDDDDGGGGGAPPTIQDICMAAASPTNLVQNGDFEVPPVPAGFITYFPPSGPPGWLLTEGSVDQVHRSFWEPACGDRSMDMTGTPGQGTLAQNVPTVAGEAYRLRFAYAANPDTACDANEPTQVTMLVRWAGQTVATLTITRTPDPTLPRTPAWQPFEATVVGQAGATLLEFDSQSGRICGPTLDAVSVQQLGDDGDDDGDDDDDDDNGGGDDGNGGGDDGNGGGDG
jgi:hypothetical protein